jgi:hypothetical protein
VAGFLLVASAFGPWVSSGTGAALAGHELGDLLLRGTLDAWAPRWAGLALYAVPLIGALLMVATTLRGRWARPVLVSLVLLAVAVDVTIGSALDWRTLRDPGWGSMSVQLGIAAAIGAVALRFRHVA